MEKRHTKRCETLFMGKGLCNQLLEKLTSEYSTLRQYQKMRPFHYMLTYIHEDQSC